MNSILEERTIDLRDLFAEIVQRLGIILLVAVLCAVALPAYKYMKDSKAANVVTELTDEEKQQVETYLSKKAIYENMEEYVNNSEFMKLNPYNTAQKVISYKVTTGTSDIDVNGIIKVFKDWINGGGITGVDNDLISCDNTSAKNTVVTDISANAFTVTLWAEEENALDEMASSLESEIDSFAAGLYDTYDFTLAKVSQAESKVYSTDVESRQQTVMTNMSTAKTELDTLYGTLTDNQKSAVENGTIENNTENVVKASISVKYIIAGFIIGLIAAAIVAAIVYVMNRKLITDDSVWNAVGIVNFGKVIYSDRQGVFKSLANKIRGIDEHKLVNAEIIASRVCKNLQGENKIILSGKVDKATGKIVDSIINELSKNNIDVMRTESVVNNIDVFKGKHENAKVIMLVHPYHERYTNTLRAYNDMKQYQFNVAGIIELI